MVGATDVVCSIGNTTLLVVFHATTDFGHGSEGGLSLWAVGKPFPLAELNSCTEVRSHAAGFKEGSDVLHSGLELQTLEAHVSDVDRLEPGTGVADTRADRAADFKHVAELEVVDSGLQ